MKTIVRLPIRNHVRVRHRCWLVSILTTAAVTTFVTACAADARGPSKDLPDGWQQAERIDDLLQSPCEGSPYDGITETAEFSSVDGRIHIAYDPAHFRCAQEVEGFIQIRFGNPDVLVQPVDMNPSSVAKCDCLYAIDLEFAIEPGQHQVTLYRRWDHLSGSDQPVEVDSEVVDTQ